MKTVLIFLGVTLLLVYGLDVFGFVVGLVAGVIGILVGLLASAVGIVATVLAAFLGVGVSLLPILLLILLIWGLVRLAR